MSFYRFDDTQNIIISPLYLDFNGLEIAIDFDLETDSSLNIRKEINKYTHFEYDTFIDEDTEKFVKETGDDLIKLIEITPVTFSYISEKTDLEEPFLIGTGIGYTLDDGTFVDVSLSSGRSWTINETEQGNKASVFLESPLNTEKVSSVTIGELTIPIK